MLTKISAGALFSVAAHYYYGRITGTYPGETGIGCHTGDYNTEYFCYCKKVALDSTLLATICSSSDKVLHWPFNVCKRPLPKRVLTVAGTWLCNVSAAFIPLFSQLLQLLYVLFCAIKLLVSEARIKQQICILSPAMVLLISSDFTLCCKSQIHSGKFKMHERCLVRKIICKVLQYLPEKSDWSVTMVQKNKTWGPAYSFCLRAK